jgi:hypothetical protein
LALKSARQKISHRAHKGGSAANASRILSKILIVDSR